jgi:hypothetical protein
MSAAGAIITSASPAWARISLVWREVPASTQLWLTEPVTT